MLKVRRYIARVHTSYERTMIKKNTEKENNDALPIDEVAKVVEKFSVILLNEI